MKAADRRFDGFGVAGGTMSCHYDNLRSIISFMDICGGPAAVVLQAH